MSSQFLGRALGSVVSPIVEYVDINGVIRRIDVDEAIRRIDIDAVLERVDVNAALERVDVNRLLDRVDVNRHLDRVDVNSHLDRVDVEAMISRVDVDGLVARSDISAIVARSSGGVFDSLLDGGRTQLVVADQAVQWLGRCGCCGWPPGNFRPMLLPPAPGKGDEYRRKEKPRPAKASDFAVEAQGRYAGALARFVAWLIDFFLLSMGFTIFLLLVTTLVQFITKMEWDANDWYGIPAVYIAWSMAYFAFCWGAAGRTIGEALLGLLVVNSGDGARIGILRAVVRTLALVLSVISVVGVLIGWVRRDGRQLHDLLACTGVVYSWDAKMAQVRERAVADAHQRTED